MVVLTRQQMLYHQKVIWDQVIQLVTDTVVTKVTDTCCQTSIP